MPYNSIINDTHHNLMIPSNKPAPQTEAPKGNPEVEKCYIEFIKKPSYENLKELTHKCPYQEFGDRVFHYLYVYQGGYIGDKNDLNDMLGLIASDVGEKQVESERKERMKNK